MHRKGYSSHFVCVRVYNMCVCVFATKSAACLIYIYVEMKVSWGLYGVAFAENALLKSSCVICWSPLLSQFPDELPLARKDSDGFLTQLMCRSGNSSYNRLTCH